MKKLLFILALAVVSCSTPENNCGAVTNKQAFYVSSTGNYDYKIYYNNKSVSVTYDRYASIKKGDTFCE